jgi:hypothetical protein
VKIARRFNAGLRCDTTTSPEGTAERVKPPWKWDLTQDLRAFSHPFGTLSNSASDPALKTPGYYHDVPPGQTVFARHLQEFFSSSITITITKARRKKLRCTHATIFFKFFACISS